jgi:hypothetical protein
VRGIVLLETGVGHVILLDIVLVLMDRVLLESRLVGTILFEILLVEGILLEEVLMQSMLLEGNLAEITLMRDDLAEEGDEVEDKELGGEFWLWMLLWFGCGR